MCLGYPKCKKRTLNDTENNVVIFCIRGSVLSSNLLEHLNVCMPALAQLIVLGTISDVMVC